MNRFRVVFSFDNSNPHRAERPDIVKIVECHHAHEAPALAALGRIWYSVAPAMKVVIDLL